MAFRISRSSRARLRGAPLKGSMVVTAAMLALTLSACGGSGSGSDPSNIRLIQTSVSLAYVPSETAIASGLFEADNLTVEMLPGSSNGINALVSGDADIAILGTPGLYAAVASGAPVKGVAISTPRPTVDLVLNEQTVKELAAKGVTPESPIAERIEALKGLKISTPSAASSSATIFNQTLMKHNIDPKADLQVVPIDDAQAATSALKANQTNGMVYGPPASSQAISQGDAKEWVSWLEGEVPGFEDLPWTVVVVSKDYLSNNTDTLVTFLDGLDQANQLVKDDPDRVGKDLKKKFFDNMDEATFTRAFDTLAPVFADGDLMPTRAQHEAALSYLEAIGLPGDLDYDEVWDTSALEKARQN